MPRTQPAPTYAAPLVLSTVEETRLREIAAANRTTHEDARWLEFTLRRTLAQIPEREDAAYRSGRLDRDAELHEAAPHRQSSRSRWSAPWWSRAPGWAVWASTAVLVAVALGLWLVAR